MPIRAILANQHVTLRDLLVNLAEIKGSSHPVAREMARKNSPSEEIDLEELRELIVHLVSVAACLELTDDPSTDTSSRALLHDVMHRIARHKALVDAAETSADAKYFHGDLTAEYQRYLDDESITQEQLLEAVLWYYDRKGNKLTQGQRAIAAPSRETIRVHRGASQYAKHALGLLKYDREWRTVHAWVKQGREPGRALAFGIDVWAPVAVEYVLQALKPFAGNLRLRAEELILRRTLDALLKAVEEVGREDFVLPPVLPPGSPENDAPDLNEDASALRKSHK